MDDRILERDDSAPGGGVSVNLITRHLFFPCRVAHGGTHYMHDFERFDSLL